MRQDDRHPEDVLGRELELMRGALNRLSIQILRTQIFGAMCAALCFIVPFWAAGREATESRPVSFLLAAGGFVAGYVVLALTGCLISYEALRRGEPSRPGEAGYFLVDHWLRAMLPPLFCSAVFAILCGIIAGFAALWSHDAWQIILVVPSAAAFAVVGIGLMLLFVLLFLIPPTVVAGEGGSRDALNDVIELVWTRRWQVLTSLAVCLVAAFLIALPGALVAYAVLTIFGSIYHVGTTTEIGPLPSLVLASLKFVLVIAPLLTCPLAFLTIYWSRKYEQWIDEAEEAASRDAARPEQPEQPALMERTETVQTAAEEEEMYPVE